MKAIDTYLDDAWQPSPEEWPKAGIPHVPKAQAERAIQAALDDAAAYRQQVAAELRGLLNSHVESNPEASRLWLTDEEWLAHNNVIHAAAARLHINLTTPQA